MPFCELRVTIDAEKAIFHRIISGVRKAVFGPGALGMREADAFVEAWQHYKSERAVALTTQAKEYPQMRAARETQTVLHGDVQEGEVS